MKIFIGSDHAGLKTKKEAIMFLKKNNYCYEDFSKETKEGDDYPDYAKKVSLAMQKNKDSFGLLICKTGIGMSITANKYKGIRAALCKTPKEAELSRAHNDANILVMSGLTLKKNVSEIIKKFLKTKFEGGRHLRRVKKIKNIEK